jgi:5-enolpyruvylshikimate-3-phosphate synthase
MSTEGTITQPSLRIITTSHTGRVNLDVDMNSLSIVTGNTYDSGIFTVSGSASSASFWMRNSATLHALDLVSGNVRVVNNSKGDSYVCTDGNLRVTINSFGNIYYQGNPQQIVVEEMSSTGSLIPLN